MLNGANRKSFNHYKVWESLDGGVGWGWGGGGQGIVVVLVVICDILTKSCPNLSLVLLLEYFLNLYLYIDIYCLFLQ